MAGQGKGKNNFIVQGSILAVAGLLVRFIGLLYRIPLTNYIGEEGIGVYSTAYSLYNILLLISSYSLPLAVSRLIAEQRAKGRYKSSIKVLYTAFMFAFISGGTMGLVCFFGADAFSALMEMPSAALAIKTLAPTIFIMAFLGVLRGYFQGMGTMVPTAASQIFEQIVNAVVSLVAGFILFNQGLAIDASSGTDGYYSSAYGAAGGTIGTGAGALTALVFFVILYLVNRRKDIENVRKDTSESTEDKKHLMIMLLMTICPVLLSTTVYQISTVIDQAIFAKYYVNEYEGIWGAFNGKYLLLVHVPTAIASAVGSALIPGLAAAATKKNNQQLADKTNMAVRFNMLIAIPATVGLAVLAKPVMDMLFSSDNFNASNLMIAGSAAIMFTALSTTTNSVLQGIGNIWIPVRNSVIALVLHIIMLVFLLYSRHIWIYAVVFSNIFFYMVTSFLNIISLHRRIGYRQEIYKSFISPLISSAIMGVAVFFGYNFLYSFTGSNGLSVLAVIVIAVIIYLELIILTRGIDESDLSGSYHGRRIARMLKKLHFMR